MGNQVWSPGLDPDTNPPPPGLQGLSQRRTQATTQLATWGSSNFLYHSCWKAPLYSTFYQLKPILLPPLPGCLFGVAQATPLSLLPSVQVGLVPRSQQGAVSWSDLWRPLLASLRLDISPGPATNMPVTLSLGFPDCKMRVLVSGPPRSLQGLPWIMCFVLAPKGRLRQRDISSDVNIGKTQR